MGAGGGQGGQRQGVKVNRVALHVQAKAVQFPALAGGTRRASRFSLWGRKPQAP